jgi:MFS family permease
MAAAGPIAGGWLIQAWSWRAIFLLNLPLAAVVIWTTLRAVPAHPQSTAHRLDGPGAALAAVGLAGLVFALIEGPARGGSLLVWGAGCVGVLALAGFLVRERRAAAPMLPLHLFRSRQFTTANLTTLTVYFALSAAMFLIVLALQRGLGYSPLASGMVLLPVTILMLVLSPIVGRVAHRIGYRVPMSIGPACAGLGLAIIALFGITPRGPAALLAGVGIFGVGLSLTVTPLTAAVMNGVPSDQAGTASGVNNAVARLASLLGVAVLPGLSGLDTAADSGPGMLPAIRIALGASAALCAAGGLIAAFGLRRQPAVAPLR